MPRHQFLKQPRSQMRPYRPRNNSMLTHPTSPFSLRSPFKFKPSLSHLNADGDRNHLHKLVNINTEYACNNMCQPFAHAAALSMPASMTQNNESANKRYDTKKLYNRETSIQKLCPLILRCAYPGYF